MAPILAHADVQERLLPYLPSGESLPQTAEEIQGTLTSPQFQQVGVRPAACHVLLVWHQECPLPALAWALPECVRPPQPRARSQETGSSLQALGMFSAALASGQLGPLMCQFGLPAEAVEAANKGGKYKLLLLRPRRVVLLESKGKAALVGSAGFAVPAASRLCMRFRRGGVCQSDAEQRRVGAEGGRREGPEGRGGGHELGLSYFCLSGAGFSAVR